MGDSPVSVQIATDREERSDRGGTRGVFGRGRGGRGGGYVARGFAAAGLTRGAPRTNGEAHESTAAAA